MSHLAFYKRHSIIHHFCSLLLPSNSTQCRSEYYLHWIARCSYRIQLITSTIYYSSIKLGKQLLSKFAGFNTYNSHPICAKPWVFKLLQTMEPVSSTEKNPRTPDQEAVMDNDCIQINFLLPKSPMETY